ncbi:anti-sigma factor family protein [Cupriavidus pauculus]|uniref:anti-sigma factor family protein n=1 Tax=Cupriavidus pauculus TaxID=82633 RepID=UPI0012471B9B|nr:anti-sigma factor [Cupriavidus pauculus]KAB0604785.1 anti-sigma factor [Cupriavidus pauculus]MCM3604741.1 anti-sigma factor [Cupriavidus pauculus]UAK98780.1 anti-sigma factor [Cupriavidus pauculus]
MDCNEARHLLQATADGEVGAADSVRLERHLEDCDGCVESLRNLQALRAATRHGAPYHRAPAALRARILEALPGTSPDASPDASSTAAQDVADMRQGWRRWFAWPPAATAALAACTIAAVGLNLFQYSTQPSSGDLAANAIVASHVRGLISNRAIDIASTDQHTVKPWFNGRIDYAPDVRDLASAGFPLVGGRLDYVDGQRVAVLVYRRNQHPIDVFVIPADRSGGARQHERQGYQIDSWTSGTMRYWAITDASADDLRKFMQAWRSAQGPDR